MEKDVKVPIVILTRDVDSGNELADYLRSRFPGHNLQVSVCQSVEECREHLTLKHYNVVVVDYESDLYAEAEEAFYNKPSSFLITLFFSSTYDVQFIFRKPSEHKMATSLTLQPGMERRVVEDYRDFESVALLVDELVSQQPARKKFNHENYMLAAALLVFFVVMAIVIF